MSVKFLYYTLTIVFDIQYTKNVLQKRSLFTNSLEGFTFLL